MTEEQIMQLIVLALVLMALGKNANLKEIEPILESIGGEEATGVIKQAEELESVISAVQSLASLANQPAAQSAPKENHAPDECAETAVKCDLSAPLAPIANIADEEITRRLSRYVALGE